MADLSKYQNFEDSRLEKFTYDNGPSTVITYVASESKLRQIKAYWEELNSIEETPIGYGYKTAMLTAGGNIRLTVDIPDEILFTTRWELETQVTQVPMWGSELIRTFARNDENQVLYPIINGEVDSQAQIDADVGWMRRAGAYQHAAQAMLAGQDPVALVESLGLAFNWRDWAIVYMFVREGGYVEWQRPILKRCRTVPFVLPDSQATLTGPPQIYTLDGIYNLFGLTDSKYDQASTVYDDLPATIPNTEWAWKLGPLRSEDLVGSGKVFEVMQWIFGRWSTINHTLIA